MFMTATAKSSAKPFGSTFGFATKCLRLRARIEELGLGSALSRLAGWLLRNCTGDGSCAIRLVRQRGFEPRLYGASLLKSA